MGLDEFLTYLTYEKRYSKHTILSYKTDLQQFLLFYENSVGIFNPKLVTERQVRAWIVELSSHEISPRSINHKITSLRVFFKFLKRIDVVKNNPVDTFSRIKQKKALPSFFDEKTMEKLFSEVIFTDDYEGIRDKMILELFYATGIRLSELLTCKLQDVDVYKGTIKVLGKRNKERIVPLYELVKQNVIVYIGIRSEQKFAIDNLFVTTKGRKIYEKMIYRIVQKYLEPLTTVQKKSPHVLRHTFATHMLNNGADLNALKELLGHANLSATQVYTHNTFEKLRNVYNKAHPRE